jgi:choloylglycine hydrolase
MRIALLVCLILSVFAVGPASACTGVVIARDGHVVVGGNEDWQRWDSFMWADAATSTLHGAVYFGYEVKGEFGAGRPPFWYEFQGINDAGLFFDSFGAPSAQPDDADMMKPRFDGRIEQLIMRWCSTVEDAVRVMTQYDPSYMTAQQFLLVDRTAAAAVVEAGEVVWMGADTFAVTNFHLSNLSHGNYPCWRYETAVRMLAEDSTPTVERIAEILDAAHLPSTRYSVVCDLTEPTAYVYYAQDFARPIVIDLAPLWAEGLKRTALGPLRTTRE